MILRTMRYPAAPPSPPAGLVFPLACIATVFGLLTGITMAGIVVPSVVQTVVPAVIRLVTGA
jgi:hypothetical protein